MRGGVILILLLGVCSFGASAASKPCQLLELASLEMTTEPDGEVAVPVTIDGLSGLMLVDTGGVQSVLVDTMVSRLQLPISRSPNQFVLFGGVRLGYLAIPHTFEMGGMTAHDMPLLVAPFPSLHTDTMGVLAPDVMMNYDVDLDFAAGTFKLFQPGSCHLAPVYWTTEPYATVPFDADTEGHIMIDIELDGKTLTAAVDTGADRSTMTLSTFSTLFGKSADETLLKLIQHASINGTKETAIYRYPFRAMTFRGIAVQDPNVDIVDDTLLEDSGGPQIILGVETLRQLHMFIAYKDERIYLTAAEAR